MNFSQFPARRIALLIAVTLLLIGACGRSSHLSSTRNASPEDRFCVKIDRHSNGIAPTIASDQVSPPARPRVLAFEMTGFAPNDTSKPAEMQKSAVTQAAVIDALAKAIIEARRSRGQSTADFTIKIGPRLTLTHKQIGDGYEVQVSLIARGVETTFVVHDCVLQHPPLELKALRQIFDETNGEFSLLSTQWSPALNGCQATVACYHPAGFDAALAGDPKAEASAP